MLIPRGTTSGQVYDLVVFVTNGDEDRVVQTRPAPAPTANCRDAISYCGVLDQLYPDSNKQIDLYQIIYLDRLYNILIYNYIQIILYSR
jgi:hypothetical protein